MARRAKSLEQMPWFLEQADEAWIDGNSAANRRLIGEKHAKVLSLDDDVSPELLCAVERLGTYEEFAATVGPPFFVALKTLFAVWIRV